MQMKNSKRNGFNHTAWLILCPVLTLLTLQNANAAIATESDEVRTIVMSGELAPGTRHEWFNLRHMSATLNNRGTIAFSARLLGPGISTHGASSIWLDRNGSLALVVRADNNAPGVGGNFAQVGIPVLNDRGDIAFTGALNFYNSRTEGFTFDSGIWVSNNSSISLVAHSWNGFLGSHSQGDLSTPVFNESGQIAFGWQLNHLEEDGTNDIGIWMSQSGQLNSVAHQGSSTYNTGETFDRFSISRLSLNSLGEIAFLASYEDKVADNSGSGIWLQEANSLRVVARSGSIAPGLGSKFDHFDHPALNNAGQVAFVGFTERNSNQAPTQGIWSTRNNNLNLVVLLGDDAAGTNAVFSAFTSPLINAHGQTVFIGSLTGDEIDSSNSMGMWRERGGELFLVAQTGSRAPGTSFQFSNLALEHEIVINSAGQIAFDAMLSGEGVDRRNNFGIWAQDISGKLVRIARTGDLFDVDDGPGTDFRVIEALNFIGNSGNEDGRGSGFNDSGELVFRATFTDGSSGIFVSNLVAHSVPEPNSIILVGIACAVLFLFRRHKSK